MDTWAPLYSNHSRSSALHRTAALIQSRLRRAEVRSRSVGAVCVGGERVVVCSCASHASPVAAAGIQGAVVFSELGAEDKEEEGHVHDVPLGMLVPIPSVVLAAPAATAKFHQPGQWLSLNMNMLMLVDCHKQRTSPLFQIDRPRAARDWIAAASAQPTVAFHANSGGDVMMYDCETTTMICKWREGHSIADFTSIPTLPHVVSVLTSQSQLMAIDCRSPRNHELIISAESRRSHSQLAAIAEMWADLSTRSKRPQTSSSTIQTELLYSAEQGLGKFMGAAAMNTRPSVFLYSSESGSPAQLFDLHAGRTISCKSPQCFDGKFSSDDRIFYGANSTSVFEMRLDGGKIRRESAASVHRLFDFDDARGEIISFDISCDNTTLVALSGYGELLYRRVL